MALACHFSEQLMHNSGLLCFSDSSRYLGSCSGSRLTIRDVDTCDVVQVFSCIDKIEKVEFSPDSEYVLCALYARCAVQVFSISDPQWKCRINEGLAGMKYARWCPDSRHVITESDFGIQLAVWSLIDGSCAMIAYPKPGNILTFSDDNNYCAVALRIELQDYIGFYAVNFQRDNINPHNNPGSSMNQWNELAKFKCKSHDTTALHFVPNSHLIVAVESALEYKITVYMPTGEVVTTYEAYQQALGIRCISMFRAANKGLHAVSNNTPDETSTECDPETATGDTALGSMLAIGSFDNKVRLMSTRSWEVVFTIPSVHPKDLPSDQLLTVDVEDDADFEDFAMTVEVIGASVGVNSNSGGEKDSLGAEFMPLKTKPSEDGSSANDGPETGNSAFISAINKRLSAMKASNAGRPQNQIGTAFVTRNLKFLPKNTMAENIRTIKGLPKIGVNWVGFDHTNYEFLGIHDETYPRCLWVWNAYDLKLVNLVVLMESIVCLRWRPKLQVQVNGQLITRPSVLAVCTGTSRVYFWTSGTGKNVNGTTTWADLPVLSAFSSAQSQSGSAPLSTSFGIYSMKWSNDGTKLLLIGRDTCCTCEINYNHCDGRVDGLDEQGVNISRKNV